MRRLIAGACAASALIAAPAMAQISAAGNTGGGGGGPATIADGGDATLGAKADAPWTSGDGTVIALLKASVGKLTSILGGVTGAVPTCGAVASCVTIGGVINGANGYETIAASQTAQVMGGSGATGDYLSHCTVVPVTTSPGVVTILDNATAIYSFPGGASSLSNLVPFSIPIAALSVSGAWKVTTGANVAVVCVGKFT